MPLIKCSKGCGADVSIPEQILSDAVASGSIDFAHDVCPKDRETLCAYRLELTVYRDDESIVEPVKLLGTGASVHAPTLVLGWDHLVAVLEANVSRLAGMVKFAEEGLDVNVVSDTSSKLETEV